MEKNSDLLTIKEFAKASGRSQQAIYKQIATRLSSYLHEIDGRKFRERRALAEVFRIGIQPEENNSFNSDNNPDHELYAILREELAAKNRQIEQLQASLDEQIQINKELAQSINAAGQQIHKRHIDHHPGRQPEGTREKPRVARLGKESQQAAYAGR